VQITRRFLQELSTRDDVEAAAEEAITFMIVPATLSIVTDMVGFATLGLVDISFYKAYAYFGMFGMLTLLLTTTTLIPLLMVTFPPKKVEAHCERGWELKVGNVIAGMLAGPGKWIPLGFVIVVMLVSTHYTQLPKGISQVASGENAEFDIMPGVEKGINYSRAAFKEYSSTIQELEGLGRIMPGVISVNIPVRGKVANKPPCGADAYNKQGERVDFECYDVDEDPVPGIFNDADVLADLEKFEDWLRAHPSIGFTGSYVQFVKLVNMLMNTPPGEQPNPALFHIPTVDNMKAHWDFYKDPGDPEFVPDPNYIVQGWNGLLQANTGVGDLDSFVDIQTWNEGIVMGFVNTMDPVKTHEVTRDIQNYLMEHADSPGFAKMNVGLKNGDSITLERGDTVEEFNVTGDPSDPLPGVGGFLGATEATRDVAMTEWLKSPLTTALAIFIISAIMFRSFPIAGILIVILMITLYSQYGLGGYFTSIQEWSGNLAFHTQVSLSIAMGLGVDYGIYMISRLRDEMQATGGEWQQALKNTLCTTGSAVIVSVVVLLGSFIPLVNTELANTWALGVYIGWALIIDVILALMVLPMLVRATRPAYVFNA
ncbi:MAG: MMPL family transporter, partial [Gammaproteobacteria bacterium]